MDPLAQRHLLTEEFQDTYQISESPHSFYVTLGQWAKETLGYGRCGCVVLAIGFRKRGAVMHGRCAIKYPHGVDADGWILANERKAMERLQPGNKAHANLCKMLDWIPKLTVDDATRSALVLEFVDGWTLADVCKRWARPLWVLMDVIMTSWLIQVGTGLEYMHEKGVVHNDLKLHNIMVTKNGDKIKIIDFGMSRVVPEGEDVDWSSDMAQLGRILAQLMSRRNPLVARDFEMVVVYLTFLRIWN